MKKTGKDSEQKISVRWMLVLAVLLIQIPFGAYFVLYSVRTVNQLNDQLAETQKDTLSVFRDNLRDQLTKANSFLYVDCWSSEKFRNARTMSDQRQAQEEIRELLDAADNLVAENANLSLVSVYYPISRGNWVVTGSGIATEEMTQLLPRLIETEALGNAGWSIQYCDGIPYYVQISSYHNAYAMVGMNLYELATNARVHSSLSASVVVRKGDRLLSSALWTRGMNNVLAKPSKQGNDWYFIDNPQSGRRYQIVETSFADMTLCMGTLYKYNWSWLYLQGIMLGAVFVLTLLAGILYLNRTFFYPLNDLVKVMRAIQKGEHPNRELPRQSKEFMYISDTFNGMLDTLEQQKIEVYENQLKAQKMEMSALRLQIRRHFFLNCLKNIYAMANMGDLESIKQMTLLLSTNLRYTLDFHKDAVDLETELRMCENYIQLQGVGQAHPPHMKTKLDDRLRHFAVPPVSILTMLENSCKYGTRQEGCLEICVTASCRRMDNVEYAVIAIQDNGNGFPSEELQMLNRNLEQIQQEGHVGMANTLARLQMLYGPGCEVLFSNRGGARVEWIVPMKQKRGEET